MITPPQEHLSAAASELYHACDAVADVLQGIVNRNPDAVWCDAPGEPPVARVNVQQIKDCADRLRRAANKAEHHALDALAAARTKAAAPRCKYCGGVVDEPGQIHAGGCGNIG